MKQQKEFDYHKFSSAAFEYRMVLGIGLRNAADQIGTSAATLCRIEKEGKTEINTILTICDWMNSPLSKFIKNKIS